MYGKAKIFHKRDAAFDNYIKLFPENVGARQIIEMNVDLVQASCGMAVPFMDFKEERSSLNDWSKKQGEDKIEVYWDTKNRKSIDDFETGILKDKS